MMGPRKRRKPKKVATKTVKRIVAPKWDGKFRDASLRVLGFESYQEYLESDVWTAIRERVFTRSRQCISCGGNASQVHHSSYSVEVLRGDDLTHVHAVCGVCHEWSEFRTGGKDREKRKKNTTNRANQLLGVKYAQVFYGKIAAHEGTGLMPVLIPNVARGGFDPTKPKKRSSYTTGLKAADEIP